MRSLEGLDFDGGSVVLGLSRVWIWVCPELGFTTGWVNLMAEFGILVFEIVEQVTRLICLVGCMYGMCCFEGKVVKTCLVDDWRWYNIYRDRSCRVAEEGANDLTRNKIHPTSTISGYRLAIREACNKHRKAAKKQKNFDINDSVMDSNNANNSILSISLDREEVLFKMPSLRELLFHVKMVCFAEEVEISPDIIERYITYCKWESKR
ncbi:hypothetical protein Droror1_Dr00006486 [Drosera rotundifolia]